MASQQFPSKDIFCPPQAFWFGDQTAPLLGWYHAAKIREAGGTRQCGVVLCPPFGHEYMVSYLSYKHLANQLAQAGFDVCFFDYHSTGDSADIDGDNGDKIELWQHNIHQATAQLRQMANVEHIVLFGLRMGALLAGSVSQQLSASAMVLMAPVISGRAYARELSVLRGMSPIQPNPHQPERSVTEEELTGYELTAATRTSMGKLDLLKLPAPVMPVLILARDDISGQEAKLANAWHHDDHALHLSDTPGYAAMMTEDAHQTTVPLAAWKEIVDWLKPYFPLEEERPIAQNNHPALQKVAHLSVAVSEIHEEIVEFNGLVGIVSYLATNKNTTLPAMVLTNIGANHRVGNHRLYVTLARTLAAQGFYVLRYDKSGIGYSKPTPQDQEHDVHHECGVDDIRSAMCFLQNRYDINAFVLAGLCSGAYLSYLAAIDDTRVHGLILMNQLTYRWHEGDEVDVRKKNSIKSTHFYLNAVTDARTWKRILTGRIEFRQISTTLLHRSLKLARTRWQSMMAQVIKNYHIAGRVARHFRAMETRGTELLFIFDADDSSIDLMTEHLGHKASLLGHSQRVHIEILNGTDHTFTPRWSQQYVANMITSHLKRRFSVPSANQAK